MVKILFLLTISFFISGCSLFPSQKNPTSTNQKSDEQIALKWINSDDEWTYYEGTIIFSGDYVYYPEGMAADISCFKPDEKTKHLIPREVSDERRAWFCFENGEEAKNLLGIDARVSFKPTEPDSACPVIGKAEIEISNYKVGSIPEIARDWPILKRVLSKEPYKRDCSL